MSRRKNPDNEFNIEPIVDEIPNEVEPESDPEPIPVLEEVNSTTKVCKITGFGDKAVHVQFEQYGVVVKVKNPERYRGRQKIRVSYSGEIGMPDFKVWED